MTDLLNLVPAVAMARAVRNDIETFVQEDVNATLSLVVFVLNIVGIVYEFRCKYTLLGVISILGLFFGLPIGMIFYIVYLVNPSICQA
jgi:hypothetical protein